MTDKLVPASDGQPAREVGAWAQEKLHYIGRYIDIFSTGMKTRWRRRVYLDLFAGPGMCRLENSIVEFPGSPLLALAARDPFTELYFNDADPEVVAALRARAEATGATNVTIKRMDCNEAARDAIEAVGLDDKSTIALAIVDPTAFQVSFDALADLTRGRPVDLIVTFMTGHLKRFIAQRGYEQPLDSFFGSRDWRALVDVKAKGGRITYRRLLDHYEAKLKSIGYRFADDHVRILNSRETTIYHLVFASKHPRGQEFFRKISGQKFSGQRRLL